MKTLVLLTALFACASAGIIKTVLDLDEVNAVSNQRLLAPVEKCEQDCLTPAEVQFYSGNRPCRESPCEIYTGEKINMIVNFTAPNYLENLEPKLDMHISILSFPVDIGEPNACHQITNTMCPLVKDEPVSYKPEFYLPSLIPDKTVASLQLSLLDKDTNKSVFCFSIDVQLLSN
ncbi:unnamed protein product [Phyllotreta striolata]|uniref:MD-2-related lipid-recognition domain-containing protein n=1 Tax=Phyllotreta striolata TaxID=444603 RepID=A0A9N9XNI4_PHYSR|nr:unnamed protein product [Phyllotreta striolata]